MQLSSRIRESSSVRRRVAPPSFSMLSVAILASASFAAHADIATVGIPVDGLGTTFTQGPTAAKIYVSGNPAKVVDVATNASRSLGVCTSQMHVNKTTQRIYAMPCGPSGTVNVIDDTTETVVATISGVTNGQYVVDETANKLYGLLTPVPPASTDVLLVVDGNANTASTIDFTEKLSTPTTIDVLPAAGKIYVTNQGTNNVTVISTSTFVASNFALPSNGTRVRTNPTVGKAYIVRQSGNAVTVMDGASNVRTHVAAGTSPFNVAFNPVTHDAYVANGSGNSVTVIRGITNIATNVATGAMPSALAFNAVTGAAYAGGNTVVTAIDPTTFATTNVSTSFPPPLFGWPSPLFALGVNAATNRIYVANWTQPGDLNAYHNGVTVIDGATNTVRSREAAPPQVDGMIVSAAVNKTFVLSGSERTILAIDGSLDPAQPTIAAGTAGNALAVDSATNTIYAGSIDYNGVSNSLTVIDGATRVPVSTGITTLPFAIAINTTTHKAYAATVNLDENLAGSLKVLDAGGIVASVTVGRRPLAVAVNPVTNKIYVANHQSNTVTVVDGVTLATTTVATGIGPAAVAVNTTTNKIYVANTINNTMTVIDGATNAASTISGAGGVGGTGLPIGIAVNEATNKVYVADITSVKAVNAATNAVTTLATFTSPYIANTRSVRVNPTTNKIYTTLDPRYLMEIDGATETVTNIPLGVTLLSTISNVEINPAANNVYVSVQNGNQVVVVDPTTGARGYIGVSHGPIAIAANATTNRVYTTGLTDGLVTEIHDVVGNWRYSEPTRRYNYLFNADYTFEAYSAPVCSKPPCVGIIDYYTGTYVLFDGKYLLTSTSDSRYTELSIDGNRLVGSDFGITVDLDRAD